MTTVLPMDNVKAYFKAQERMRLLRLTGMTYTEIGRACGISGSTARLGVEAAILRARPPIPPIDWDDTEGLVSAYGEEFVCTDPREALALLHARREGP